MSSKGCNPWCAPAVIMALLSVISVFLSIIHPYAQTTGEKISAVVLAAVNGAFWTGVTYWLCSICREGWALVILLLPIIVSFLMLLLFSSVLLSILRNRGAAPPVKEKFASYPFANVQYQALPLNNPSPIKSVSDFSTRPTKFLRDSGPSAVEYPPGTGGSISSAVSTA